MTISHTAGKAVTLLGSTGSIGTSTLKVLEYSPHTYRIEALVAGNNVDLLIAQARQYKPAMAVIADEAGYPALKAALEGTGVAVAAGHQAVNEAAARPSEWVMSAIVGAAGLEPTITAIRRGATLALANKECLVCAGALMMREVKDAGATLVPVDSEHNAIFQVFDFQHPERVESITLTASGGPFRAMSREQMASVTPKQAVAHPNWSMGAKISVDSATMMNKGLEMIEAFHLFPVTAEQINVVVHPESIIHSMVYYTDGSVLAQMGMPDMCTPISVSLAWPDRIPNQLPRLDLAQLGKLTFEKVDEQRFPAIAMARQVMGKGAGASIIFNTANEVAVAHFLKGRLPFLSISQLVSEALEQMTVPEPTSIEAVQEAITHVREQAEILAEKLSNKRCA